MKNEAWVFSIEGQQNEDAMGQMKFSPNEIRLDKKKRSGFSNTEKNLSTGQWWHNVISAISNI